MREKIIAALKAVCDDNDFEASKDFLEDGLVDSFQMVELVGELEDAFSIEIGGSDIVPENFVNLDALVKLVSKYTEG